MKQFLFYLLLFSFGANVFAQNETRRRFKPIKPKTTYTAPQSKPETNLPETSLFKLEVPVLPKPNIWKNNNFFGNQPKPLAQNSFQIGVTKNDFSMVQKDNFQHKSGDNLKEKLQGDLSKSLVREGLSEDKSQLDRAGIYLGDFYTKSPYFILKYRDFLAIDGDLINVYINGKQIASELFLNSNFQEFKINLEVGINNIDFVVASTGTQGGNTAEIYILDDLNREIAMEYWLGKVLGVKVNMLVIRLKKD